MQTKFRKLGSSLALLALIASISATSDISRNKRSPFKKHKVVVTEVQQNEGGGWGAPPPPPPPPQQETIIEHHHHYEIAPPPAPPPPSSHSHSIVIEVNKGGHGSKVKDDIDKLKQFKGEIDSTIDAIERDKQEKIEAFKEDAEAKLDALAKIPHMIASDIDFIGRKIVEDLERKKKKEGGLSIQVWKGKGSGQTSSEETVEHHHHHYYPPPPPPPRQTEPPPPPPPPSRGGWRQQDVVEEGLYKVVDAGAQFMDFLGGGGGGKHKGHISQEGSFESGEGQGWQQSGKEKGFRLRVWKSKGFRRRR